MDGDPEIRVWIRKIRFFRKFFFAFFASMDLLGPQGHPRTDRSREIRTRIREIRFFENLDFSFFDFLSLKTLQYGCLWTPLLLPTKPVHNCGLALPLTFYFIASPIHA